MNLTLNKQFKNLVAAKLQGTPQPRTKHIHVSDTDKLRNIIIDANFDLHTHFQAIMSHTQKIVCTLCECTYIIIFQVPQS